MTAAPVGRGSDNTVDALGLDATHYGGGIALYHVGHHRAAHSADHVAHHIVISGIFGFVGVLGDLGRVTSQHFSQQGGCASRHLVVGDAGICLVGEPGGDQFIGVGLEDAGKAQHLFSLGAAFAMFVAAIGGHIDADGLGKVFLKFSAAQAQLLDFLGEQHIIRRFS